MIMKNTKNLMPSFLKYLFPYFTIVTVLILGFFLVIRNQLMDEFLKQSVEYANIQLNRMGEQLHDDLVFLSQIDVEIINNKELRDYRHSKEVSTSEKYYAVQELKKYKISSPLISDIVFMSKNTMEPLALGLSIVWESERFIIKDNLVEHIVFDPTPYMEASSGQLVFLDGKKQNYLIYFPVTNTQANYIYFYVLDIGRISDQLKKMMSAEMKALALVGMDGKIILGENVAELMSSVDTRETKSIFCQTYTNELLCANYRIMEGISLYTVLSIEYMYAKVNHIFIRTYLILLCLGMVGVLITCVGMKMTFVPLRDMARRLTSDMSEKKDYLKRLEDTFEKMESEKFLISKKLDDYRFFMQKLLLDSFIRSWRENEGEKDLEFNEVNLEAILDSFLDGNKNKKIFIVRLLASNDCELKSGEYYKEYLKTDKGECVVLKQSTREVLLLIDDSGVEKNKRLKMEERLFLLYQQDGCLSVFDQSDSPLDVPKMYKNVTRINFCDIRVPVLDMVYLPSEAELYVYPKEQLEKLTEVLEKNDFMAARILIREILVSVERFLWESGEMQSFFVSCILIDMLTNLVSYMNQSHIRFTSYSDLYYETLYFCRSCQYNEKKTQIAVKFEKIIDLCEQNSMEKRLKSINYSKVIEECYCMPDFSIAVLAERFQVSVPYMSNLFKTGMNMNFSDYLWKLRLEKAKELLCTTAMTVDDVAMAVGYTNTSSFRRKFKAETGYSPLQFRLNAGIMKEK